MQRSQENHETVTEMLIGKVKKFSHTILIVMTLALCLFLAPSTSWSASLTWIGNGADADFNTANNWTPDLGRAPDSGDSCTINSTTNHQPSVLSNAVCGSLDLGTGGTAMTLTIPTGQSLRIAGPTTIGANGTMNASGTSSLTMEDNVDISGVVNLSGTCTWSQNGVSKSIVVNSGGLLSAQGTDGLNRVTFTRSQPGYFDMLIGGGIDFNYVNVFFTASAKTNAGFSINSPGGATVNFDNVALNNTEDRNGAVMIYWNANRTINATGITFDSSTYSQADGDVNVEATQGTINFINAGGNYAGEDKDNDNGGIATWQLSIVKQAWEVGGTAPLVSPANVPTGMTIVFLIYVKNITASPALDVRINDDLDTAGFQYIPGSLVRDDGSLADTATDLQIFNATAPGTGTPQSDAQDADIASSCDVSEALCPGSEADRSTIGAVAAQPNATVNINGNATFAIRFRVTVK